MPLALPLAHAADGAGRTPALLPFGDNQCSQVPGCVVTGGQTTAVAAGSVATVALTCPESTPHAWHWDTEQHVHVAVQLVGRSRSSLTFRVINQGDLPGEAKIVLGCSAAPFDVRVAGSQNSRSGARPRITPLEGNR